MNRRMPRPIINLLLLGVSAAGAGIAATQRRRRRAAALRLGNNPGNQGRN